jgi:hypothetical protein
VVVGDKLYLFGGFDTLKQTFTPTDRAWSYDAATNHWSALPTMPVRGITHAGIATDGAGSIWSAKAGTVLLSFRVSRSSKVTLVLERCTSRGCRAVSRIAVGSPRGPSHVSVLAVGGQKTLSDGHYRLVATPAGGRSVTAGLLVRG